MRGTIRATATSRAAPHGDGCAEPHRTEVEGAAVAVPGQLVQQVGGRVQREAEDEQGDRADAPASRQTICDV